LAIYLCSFSELRPEPTQLPVRTSQGWPRYKLRYELQAYCGLVTPGRWFNPRLGMELGEYEENYRRQLDQHGAAQIAKAFTALARKHQVPDLVLLCFDNLSRPGQWCHRSMFADWWLENTGEECTELGRVYQPPEPPGPDLFDALNEGT
jgi:hypothetical protein